MRRVPQVALSLSGFLLLCLTVRRALRCWTTDARLDHVAGVWVAQAIDITHGAFYRAAYGPCGYGGSRYFPLFYSLHGAAIELFGNWRPTGYALSTASVVLLLVAVYHLLRRLGATRWLAVAGCLAVLAGASVQNSLFTIREDAMAAMLNIWALAACVGASPTRRRLAGAAALFTLAFAVKETTIFGAAAVFLYLLLNQQRRSALRLMALTAGGYALVLAGIVFGSGGRALQGFRLTAAAGVGFTSIAASPFRMVGEMDMFWGETILLTLGLAVLLATGAQSLRRFPPLLFAITLAATVAIFSSEGIGGNHLIDVHIAAVVLVIDWAVQMGAPEFAISTSAALCLIIWLGVTVNNVAGDAVPVREQLQAVVRAIERKDQPILAENPLVPILAGQQPYLLDPFNFRVMLEARPELGEPMWKMLHQHGFAAVVLEHDPSVEEWSAFYTDTHFGPEFMERLQQDYALAGTPGGQYLFLPRGSK